GKAAAETLVNSQQCRVIYGITHVRIADGDRCVVRKGSQGLLQRDRGRPQRTGNNSGVWVSNGALKPIRKSLILGIGQLIEIVSTSHQMSAVIAGIGNVNEPLTGELTLNVEVPLLGHGRPLITLI